jgi:DNA-binding LytR/AlgR family response regulator
MIRLALIEDELPAANRLKRLLGECDIKTEVVAHCDSAAKTKAYLATNPPIDLLLCDIRLGDGLSIEALLESRTTIPVIFTTAYNEFALEAFKLYSIDYLLKPIAPEDLQSALQKFINFTGKRADNNTQHQEVYSFLTASTKSNFTLRQGNQLIVIPTSDIAYFYAEEGLTFLVNHLGKRYIWDATLDQLQKELPSHEYFRINRGMLVKHSAILKIEQYPNGRYLLTLHPDHKTETIVARERAKDFKEWLGG